MSIILGPQNRHISQILYLNKEIVPVDSWIQSYHDQLKNEKLQKVVKGFLKTQVGQVQGEVIYCEGNQLQHWPSKWGYIFKMLRKSQCCFLFKHKVRAGKTPELL